MATTYTLVSELLEIMAIRTDGRWEEEEHKAARRQQWNRILERAKAHKASNDELAIVIPLLDVMEMQDKREAGEFHIPGNTAWHLWNSAREKAEAYLQQIGEMMTPAAGSSDSASKVPEAQSPKAAEGYLKQRATGLQRGGCTLRHSQILHAIARSEGYKSFQALKSALPKFGPAFCPHCGAAGTLENVGSVYCEQGEWDGKGYEAEGDGVQYSCKRCTGQFTDWSGLGPATFDVNVYENASELTHSSGSNLGTFDNRDKDI